ncbi:MAG: hypothetical protein FJ290_23150, partial [Planctomycetes bacterium]|nr:hypothetical protein [Planctomycetota bacterium]
MSTCPPEEKLGAYVDGELAERERAAIEAHVRACKPCADAVADLCDLDRMAHSVDTPEVSPQEWTTTWTGIGARVAPAVAPQDWTTAWDAIAARVSPLPPQARRPLWRRPLAWAARLIGISHRNAGEPESETRNPKQCRALPELPAHEIESNSISTWYILCCVVGQPLHKGWYQLALQAAI